MSLRKPKSITECQKFFLEATHPRQRMYEALRLYYLEGKPSHEAAKTFGYTPGSFRVLCHEFRHNPEMQFFVQPKPGPRDQPKKGSARPLIIAMRKQNNSVYDISEALKTQGFRLSPTAVREVLKEEGFAPLPRRRDEERPSLLRPAIQPAADVRAFSLEPRQFTTRCGGLFLFIPELIRLDLELTARQVGLPGRTRFPGSMPCGPVWPPNFGR